MSIAVNDIPVSFAKLHLPAYGQWVCEAQLIDSDDGSFQEMLAGGVANLDTVVGRIVPSQTQSFALRGSIVFTAGRGAALSEPVTERAYHDDSGVNALTVLDDLLGDTKHTRLDVPSNRLGGKHYLRERGPASRAITALLGKRWTFDLAGRFTVATNADFPTFDILEYDASNQRCVLALDSLKDPRGLALTELGKSVQSAVVVLDKIGIRAECQLGEMSLPNVIEAMVEAIIARKVLAPQLYRVHSMEGARVNLQPYEASAGLPDLISVPQYPGVAGAAPSLSNGQVVVVQWIGSDRTKPIITQYIGEGAEHVSQSIVFNDSAAVAARVADPVAAGPLPGQTVTFGAPGAVGPMTQGTPYPFTFAMATPLPGKDPTKLHGSITSSSSTVKL